MKYFFLLIIWSIFISSKAQISTWNTDRPILDEQGVYINSCNEPFYHGVASGDPLEDRVIIWTRITPMDSTVINPTVNWELSSDLDFTNILQNGSNTTDASNDFTIKVDVTGLSANSYYYYRFEYQGDYSMIGRTKTAPNGWSDQLRFGFVSCSDYRQGYFTAYRKLAERNDLDAIVHLGDYIYEGRGGPSNRLHEPDANAYRLQDYRTRFSQYRLDPDLMRCHQVHPFVIIWDDHDIVVDALRDTSYRHDATLYGPYSDRKYAAVKAIREWLPIRDDISEFYKNWKKLPFGNLVDLFTIDVRLYDRDRIPNSITDTIFGNPNHKILGPVQMNWINNSLNNSTAKWKLIANQLVLGHLQILGTPVTFENWDGYPAERLQFLNNLSNNSVDNTIVLTGDFHCSFAMDITPDPYNSTLYDPASGNGSLATEFVVPSITGDNFDEGNDFGLPNAAVAVDLIKLTNPHVKFTELEGHGYILLDLDSSRAQAEFWYMSDIRNPENKNEYIHEIYVTHDGSNKVVRDSVLSIPKSNIPTAPEEDTCNSLNVIKHKDPPVLLSVSPNPFNQFLTLNYAMNQSNDISVKLLNLSGVTVLEYFQKKQQKGNYQLYFETEKLSPGSYFLVFETKEKRVVYKVIKLE